MGKSRMPHQGPIPPAVDGRDEVVGPPVLGSSNSERQEQLNRNGPPSELRVGGDTARSVSGVMEQRNFAKDSQQFWSQNAPANNGRTIRNGRTGRFRPNADAPTKPRPGIMSRVNSVKNLSELHGNAECAFDADNGTTGSSSITAVWMPRPMLGARSRGGPARC